MKRLTKLSVAILSIVILTFGIVVTGICGLIFKFIDPVSAIIWIANDTVLCTWALYLFSVCIKEGF